jgi:phosphatidylglycerol:prolipoprotein diacylglycerol transferase
LASVLFRLGPINVYTFGFTLSLGFLTATFIAAGEARRRGLSDEELVNAALIIMAAGLIAARAGYVWANWDYFAEHSGEIWQLTAGGLSFHGGLLGGLAGAFIFAQSRGWSFRELADCAALGLALGYALARVGCHGPGRPTAVPWGMAINGMLVHPQGAYAIVVSYAIFVFLWKVRLQTKFRGQLFVVWSIAYGVSRFFIEYFRYGRLWGPFTLTQWASLAMVAGGAYLYRRWEDGPPPHPRPLLTSFTRQEALRWLLGLALLIWFYYAWRG